MTSRPTPESPEAESPASNPSDPSLLEHLLADIESQLERRAPIEAGDLARIETLARGVDRPTARRVDRVVAFGALRARDVPEGVLDDLYGDVRARATALTPAQARMSTAFLDAPRSLAVWRRAALAGCAACVLVVGFAFAGDPASVQDPRDGSRRLAPVDDPRTLLLDPVADRAPARAGAVTHAPLEAISDDASASVRGDRAPLIFRRDRPLPVFRPVPIPRRAGALERN